MKNNTYQKIEEIMIKAQAVAQTFNNEAVRAGEAARCVNMRERENALQAVGEPKIMAQLAEGDKLLLVDGNTLLTLQGTRTIKARGNVVAEAEADVLGADITGDIVTVHTTAGPLWLRRSRGYCVLDPNRAMVSLLCGIVGTSTETIALDATEFDEPYTEWRSPLRNGDSIRLNTMLARAYQSMQNDARKNGRLTGPVLVRYALRLWDDNYLWASQPVLLGRECLSQGRAVAKVTTSGTTYTGIEATVLQRTSYRIGLAVGGGVGSEWKGLVKAIDVWATPAAATETTGGIPDYRCATDNNRQPVLEYGPQPRSNSAIVQDLFNADWHLAASTSNINDLDEGNFNSSGVAADTSTLLPERPTVAIMAQPMQSKVMTNADWAKITRYNCENRRAQCSLDMNGRLLTAGGTIKLQNTWSALPQLHGVTSQPCTIRTTATLSTDHGDATIVRSEQLDYTPTSLNPLLCYPDARATGITIEVESDGAVSRHECQLWPMHESGMACSVPSDMNPRSLQSTTYSTLPDSCSVNDIDAASHSIHVSAAGNPLVRDYSYSVSGTDIQALAVAERPIYSGGFGRYPVYVFTSQGLWALPQKSSGLYSEPRIIHRAIIDPDVLPVAGGGHVWFATKSGQLMNVRGATVSRTLRGVSPKQLAWNDTEQELWLLQDDGTTVLMPSGHTAARTLQLEQLYGKQNKALAVDSNFRLLDLTQESNSDAVAVEYLSHPVVLDQLMRSRPLLTEWNMMSTNADLQLSVRGERGGIYQPYPCIISASARKTLSMIKTTPDDYNDSTQGDFAQEDATAKDYSTASAQNDGTSTTNDSNDSTHSSSTNERGTNRSGSATDSAPIDTDSATESATTNDSTTAEESNTGYGFLINKIAMKGCCMSPIMVPVATQPLRSVQFHVSGTTPTGSLLLPIMFSTMMPIAGRVRIRKQ